MKNGYCKDPLPESEEYIQASIDFWSMVNAEASFIEKHRRKTKGDGSPSPHPIQMGHWEVISVITEYEEYDSIGHLTQTEWYQGWPFNSYCPQDTTNGHLVRCPAGCVAIAGAQMLYYLHGKDGVPVYAPSQGSCVGYVYDNSYIQNFWNPSSTIWNYMNYAGMYAAPFVGDIGKKLEMDYHANGSGAKLSYLVDKVFSPYGWDCTLLNEYSAVAIVSSLMDGYPVVCGGLRLLERDVEKVGHAFLVDRYKRSQAKTTIIYEWISDNPDPEAPANLVPFMEEIIYGSPYISHYGMNWGQGNSLNDDLWCSMEGIWQYGTKPPYIYNRKMIHNFTIKE